MEKKNYIGVKWSAQHKKFKSYVTKDSVHYPCGYHDTEILAVKARDIKIVKLGLDVKLQILKKL